MILIVGLGNPGEKYKKTRHNLGRLVVSTWQLIVGFPDFRLEKKSNALISKGTFEQKRIILALPETYMNNSGKSVKSLTTRYKIPARGPLRPRSEASEAPAQGEVRQRRRQRRQDISLIIAHDDIDLPFGMIRISINRGAAGHKGVESIINELGTKNFIRVRIGIMPERGKPKNVEKFVLQRFNKEEKKTVQKIMEKGCAIIEIIIKEGIEKARQKYNQ